MFPLPPQRLGYNFLKFNGSLGKNPPPSPQNKIVWNRPTNKLDGVFVVSPTRLCLPRSSVDANRFERRSISWTVASSTRKASFIVRMELPAWLLISKQAGGPKFGPRATVGPGRSDLEACYVMAGQPGSKMFILLMSYFKVMQDQRSW